MKQKISRIISGVLLSTILTGAFPMTLSSVAAEQGYAWQGKWIWTSNGLPSGQDGQWVNLRKTFSLKEIPTTALARIAVDSRYWMWINGEMVVYEGQLKMGPTSDSWYYDTVDLTPYLKEGENTVAVLACYWGFASASAIPTGNQGFLFDAEFSAGALADGSTRLVSDASWKVMKNEAYEAPEYKHNGKPDSVNSKFNASKAIEGWQTPSFNDSAWQNATVKTLSATDPRRNLVERSIPHWKVDEIVKHDPSEWIVQGDSASVVEPLDLPESYTVTAEVKSLNNVSIGLALCVTDGGHFYMPQVQKSDSGVTVKPHLYNGKWNYPALENGAVAPVTLSEKMTLTAEVNKTSVTVYVNGTRVGSFTDSSLAREGNTVGFRSSTSEKIAVYSMKIADTEGNTLWEDTISESKAGDDVQSFKKISGAGTPTLEKDATGTTYLLVQNCVVGAGNAVLGESSTYYYSFYNSTNMQGVPYIKVRSQNGGEVIKLSSDSTSHSGGESVLHWYVTKAGEQEYEPFGWMSAWRVDFTVPAGVEVLELGWRQSSYNTEHTGYVNTDNEGLNQLYQEAYDTLLITMRDIYMDCPDRERQQWWGDAVLEMQQAAYAMDSNARLLYKKLLQQAVGYMTDRGGTLSCVPTNQNFMEMPAQCLAGVHSLWQYYLYYGETDILETCYDTFLNYLKLWNLDETGYLNHRAGTSDWLDWGGTVDASVIEYCLYYVATENMKNVAEVLGKNKADTDFLQARMDLMKQSFDAMYWVDSMGAYFSNTSNGTPDERAQAMAVYAGLADPARYPAIYKSLTTLKNVASPYGEKYIIEALYLMGYAEEAISRTLARYDVMLKDGHPTLVEDFDPNKLSGNAGTATRNHAWSGGPLSLTYMYNAGILSTGAGFKTVRIKPMIGSLNEVSASTDTPAGTISVKVTQTSLQVTIPVGTESAEICVPRLEKATTVTLGGTVLYTNGAVAASLPNGIRYAGEDADCIRFTVGAGTYAFAMTEDTAGTGSTHTLTVTSVGEGSVLVNGKAVQTPYVYTGTGSVTVTAAPSEGNRVAYFAGAYPETVYSNETVARSYTLDRDATLQIAFDKPEAEGYSIRIIDASRDETTASNLKGMFYAYHLYVNGEEVYVDQYVRDSMLPLPYVVAAQKGETVTIAVKPVAESNYGVGFDDGSGEFKNEITYTVDSDQTVKIIVSEKSAVQKIPIQSVTSNSINATSGAWAINNVIDGARISGWSAANGYASKGFASNTPAVPITLTLDLGSIQAFNQVSLFPRTAARSTTGGARCYPKDFTISISLDGNSFYEVASYTDHPDPYVHQQVYEFGAVEARYVRITVTKLGSPDYHVALTSGYRLQIAEAEVAYVKPAAKPIPGPEEDTTVTDETTTAEPIESDGEVTTEDNRDGEKKGGCSSSAAGGLATVMLTAAAACASRKKKNGKCDGRADGKR